MMLLVYVILLLLYVMVDADILWSAPMDGEGLSEWTIRASNNPSQKNNDNNCPDNDDCWAICGQNSNSNEAYIYRRESTRDFKNIRLTFNLEPHSMSMSGEECSLRYSINGDTSYNSFTEFFTATDTDKYQVKTVYLPAETWDNSNVGIMILALNSDGDCCYTSDLLFKGDPITTSPTPAPTKIPTRTPTTPAPLSYRGISPGTWQDDFELAPPTGWLVSFSPKAIPSIVITQSSDSGLTYHGPYIGDNNSSSQSTYSIYQTFYCVQKSSVSVSFYIYFCETESNTDWIKFYLNNILQLDIGIQKTDGSAYTSDSVLNSAAPSDCTTGAGWRQMAMGPYDMPQSLAGALFNVKFEFSINFDNDAVAVSRTDITCTPLPTTSPTPAPTQIPTSAPSNTPTSPPTAYPSSTPTFNPTHSTNTPSIVPTPAPTLHPTNFPSNNPSTAPSSAPSSAPSNVPTSTPSNMPTSAPSAPSSPTTPAPTLRIAVVGEPTVAEHNPTVDNNNVEHAETTVGSSGHVTIDDINQVNEGDPLKKYAAIDNFIFVGIGVLLSLCCLACFFCINKRKNQNKESNKLQITNVQMMKVNSNNNLIINSNNSGSTMIKKMERLNSGSNIVPSTSDNLGSNSFLMTDQVINIRGGTDGPIANHVNIRLHLENSHMNSININTNAAISPTDSYIIADDEMDENEDITNAYAGSNTKGYENKNKIDTESDDEMDEGTQVINDDFIINGDDEDVDNIMHYGYQTQPYRDNDDVIVEAGTNGYIE